MLYPLSWNTKRKDISHGDKEYRIKITDEGRKAVGLLYYRNIISESHKGSDYFDEMQSIDRVGINERKHSN